MLEGLDDIPWSTLEHAYGDAADIPNIIRVLVSSDPGQREWAQDMLDMGPFHQGSLYSCTPFVVRVLLQIAPVQDTVNLAWVLEYVARVLAVAMETVPDNGSHPGDGDEALAAQIRVEVRLHRATLLSMLDYPDGRVRLALLRLLMLLQGDVPSLTSELAEKLGTETDQSVRAALVFCLGLIVDDSYLHTIQAVLEDVAESPLIRIAAGFGLICAMKEHTTHSAVSAFCGLITDNYRALDDFEDLYAQYLSPLGAPLGKDRLLECLQVGWSSHHRGEIVTALLRVYAQLPLARGSNIRAGWAYYLDTMARLAFSDGKLLPDATIGDLNDLQRRVLEAFQRYDLPSYRWNVYGPSDYRTILGFDFRSEADFLGFMSGERTAGITRQ